MHKHLNSHRPTPWQLLDRIEDPGSIVVPSFDASQRGPNYEDVEQFLEAGAIVIENFLSQTELERWREEVDSYYEKALASEPQRLTGEGDEIFMKRIGDKKAWSGENPPGMQDTLYQIHPSTGRVIPRMIDFNLDKSPSCRKALASPVLMQFAELAMGPNFVNSFDAMIIKNEGAGMEVSWHRDRREILAEDPRWPTIVPGIYLDDSDEATAVRIAPGSQKLKPEPAKTLRNELAGQGFDGPGIVPVPVKAGTLVIHHAHCIHGSPESCGGMRRVQYLGMRTLQAARIHWHDTMIMAHHRRHLLCIAERMSDPLYRGETPYHYRGDSSILSETDPEWQTLPLFRIIQNDYQRNATTD